MIVTKLGIAAGVVVLGVLCWLAAAGVSALTPVLVTGAALVVMVGGGNWLGGRTPHGPPPATAYPATPDEDGAAGEPVTTTEPVTATEPDAPGGEVAPGEPDSRREQ